MIEKESREHIIQNALGGLYESADICCNKCNNSIISKEIDAPFIRIFNPIISRIENMAKTNNKNSKPSCRGKAKCDASKLEFEIIEHDFQYDKSSFEKGISKIAYNFAVDKGVMLCGQ